MFNGREIILENAAIAMHCNLRPSDAVPVPTRFNFVTRAKFEVARAYPLPSYSTFAADTLRYDATLNYDLEHL